jgi:RNA polymerase sigma-70 factor, ECF subfamily
LRAWVFRLARNRVIDDSRRRRARPVDAVAEIPERVAADELTSVDPDLVEALERLTPDQREVVLLRFVADLPVREVARLLRRRPGAVKQLQARALSRLESLVASRATVDQPAT